MLAGLLLAAGVNAQPTRVMSLNLCTDVLALHLAQREHIVSLSHIATNSPLSPIVEQARGIPSNRASAEEIVAFQHLVRKVPMPEPVARYAVNLARRTRPGEMAQDEPAGAYAAARSGLPQAS